MRFEVLPGLPVYGPPALSFPKTDRPAFREGLVIRFRPERSEPWVSNFRKGETTCNAVLDHPNGADVVAVSCGDVYIVDVENRSTGALFASGITRAFKLPSLGLVVLQGMVDFAAIGAAGLRWRSERISWDGFRKVRIAGHRVLGEAFTPVGDDWVPFELDLVNGRCTNAVYQHEIQTAVPVISQHRKAD